jgi:cGMP-dependent protein kinase
VAAAETIFSQGDPGDGFYIIHTGTVDIHIMVDNDGEKKKKKLRQLGMGDYFGERAMIYAETRSATVTAAEDSELWRLTKSDFLSVMSEPILDYMKERIELQNVKVSLDSLECIRIVGRGGFGVVKMVRDKTTGTRYALKCVSKRQAVESCQQQALVVERSILAELDHPFVIKFVRSFRGDHYLYFLMELVTGGELLDALAVLGLLNKKDSQFYIGSIGLALEFLHERRICYLDLKGENCLIDSHGYLKIIDFGVAERINAGRCHVVKGTPLFMAPEVIRGLGFTTSADLWSLGVCAYDFMIGEFPFGSIASSQKEIFEAVLKKPLRFPPWFRKHKESADLVRGLLSRDATARPGAGPDGYAAFKSHPFFDGFDFEGLLGRTLAPPFIPQCETYAEDQEEGGGAQLDESPSVRCTVFEEENSVCRTNSWVDPDPNWDEEF